MEKREKEKRNEVEMGRWGENEKVRKRGDVS